ncbi:MAG: homoserine kinase [Candidatus Atribacteria bacterium]|nr:homoserine kinase [Candidatus Atribacteria bacterium]
MIEVRIPATTANLGCGFDVLGMALDLYYTVHVRPIKENKYIIRNRGEGEHYLPEDDRNLFFKTVKKVSKMKNFPEQGLEVEAFNQIPVCRGLGSSAACIAAAIVTVNELNGRVLSIQDMIHFATQIEGHPDNVIPAMVGGLTVAMKNNQEILYQKFPFFDNIHLVACIPEYTLSTEEMRKILPSEYSREDVIYNLSRIAYLMGSICRQDREGFFAALDDAIHQPFRGQKIPGFFEIREYLHEKGKGEAVISGSGSTILLMLRDPISSSDEAEMRELFAQKGTTDLVIKKVNWESQGIRVIQR